MGTCVSCCHQEPTDMRAHIDMNEPIITKRTTKMMMLGAGSGGKSTIFRQLHCIYRNGLDKRALNASIAVIRSNCVAAILRLLQHSVQLYEFDNIVYKECHIDFRNNELHQMINEVLGYAEVNFENIEEYNAQRLRELSKAIKHIWNLSEIQYTFDQRHRFSLITNMDYFFDKVDVVFSEDYEGTVDDVLHYRLRTTGICDTQFEIDGSTYRVYDVGGQRNERKKWINAFEKVDAILYVVSLTEYAAVLFEEEQTNAMHESLQLFEEIATAKWFKQTNIILIFTKDDLFQKKLKTVPLSTGFDCYYEDWKDEEYDGPNYDENEDEEHFENVYKSSLEFIQGLFEKRYSNSSKRLYSFVTDATDTKSIEKIFGDISHILINQPDLSSFL